MMTRVKGLDTMFIAINQLRPEPPSEEGDVQTLLRLRRNARLYQTILTSTIGTPTHDTELDEQLLLARETVNGIIHVLNQALLLNVLLVAPRWTRDYVVRAQREYSAARDCMSYLISLVDTVAADDFDAANA